MTKFPNYDEMESGELPRICGGPVFLKLMKKTRCGAFAPKNQSPLLTSSSSSFSTSQESATSFSNYDPSNTHFCMPRQNSSKEGYKLNFKLQADEYMDFHFNNETGQAGFSTSPNKEVDFHGEAGTQSHSIIQFSPRMISDSKTKHMQPIDEKGSSKIVPSNAYIEDVLDDEQGVYESKAHILRKQMSSFRKELHDVKKSLPNQFGTSHFTDENDDVKEIVAHRDLSGDKIEPRNHVKLEKNNHQIDDWDFTAFVLDSSEEQSRKNSECEKKYFKNDWDFNFQPNENRKKKSSSSSSHEIFSSDIINLKLMQNNENKSSVLKTNESFPECPEMPFDQGLNPEEIEINASSTSNTDDEPQESTATTSYISQELERVKSQISNFVAQNSEQRKKTEDIRASEQSNVEEDMALVKMLLRKYGDKIDESAKADKARRIQAIIGAPTDAWFHRHASGIFKNSDKLSTSEASMQSNEHKKNTVIHKNFVPETPKKSVVTNTQPSFKNINRVDFENAEEKSSHSRTIGDIKNTEDERLPVVRNTDTVRSPHTPGKLSAKIKFWEEKNNY